MITLKAKRRTWLKASIAQAATLPSDQKYLLTVNQSLPIVACTDQGSHWHVTLGKDSQQRQVNFNGKNTWYVYKPDVSMDGLPIAQKSERRSMGTKGLQLLKSFEGCRLESYQDVVGIWTIGYGSTSGIQDGMTITQDQAEALLLVDLHLFESAVAENVVSPIDDDQFDALVSFTYNVGVGALERSTLLGRLNYGDCAGAADEFLKWDGDGNGGHIAGLTRRRQAERALFLGQDFTVYL